jgi:hypothetical protein
MCNHHKPLFHNSRSISKDQFGEIGKFTGLSLFVALIYLANFYDTNAFIVHRTSSFRVRSFGFLCRKDADASKGGGEMVPVDDMRVKEVKAELEMRGVSY